MGDGDVSGFAPFVRAALWEDKGLPARVHTRGNRTSLTHDHGKSIGPNCSDQDVADLLHYVTLLALFAAVSTAHFLGWVEAKASGMKILDEFLGVDA